MKKLYLYESFIFSIMNVTTVTLFCQFKVSLLHSSIVFVFTKPFNGNHGIMVSTNVFLSILIAVVTLLYMK